MKKLNVAMFSDSFFPIVGGRENVIDNIMRELFRLSNTFLLTPKLKGHKEFVKDENLPYTIFRCKGLRITKNEYLSILDKNTKKLIEDKIKNGEIDIIHTQTKYALCKYALKLGKKYNIPVVTTAHTDYISQYKNQLKCPLIYKPFLAHVKKTINKTDAVFTVSNHMRNLLLNMGVTAPITIIPNGNDLLKFKTISFDHTEIKQNLGIKKTEYIFIYVGRITETKNLSFLLNTLKELKEKGLDFKMLMVGSGEVKRYEALTKTLKIDKNIIFTGKITDREMLAKLYSIADLNLYPSTGESFGLTIREAGIMGTPSVTIENCATSEDIINKQNGFISKYDINSFANTILDAVKNKNRLKEIGSNAKNSFNLSWSTVAEKHLQEYSNIINKKHH